VGWLCTGREVVGWEGPDRDRLWGVNDRIAWFGALMRQARRDADMSQRELARWSGVPKSVVADAETGRATPFDTARRLLQTAGYKVVIENHKGEEVDQLMVDDRRDRHGRRYPPHLDVRELSPSELTWRRWFEYRPNPLTAHSYRLDREARDAERYVGYYGEGPHNWLPPHPDKEYIRSVLGREPVLPWFAPTPLVWDYGGPFDRVALELAGRQVPDPRKRKRPKR
jgi:transcriptional regulator with XRE-family HTH domain